MDRLPSLTNTPRSSLSFVALFVLSLWLLAAPVQGQTRLFLAEYAFNNPKLKTMLLDGSALTELTAPPASDWLLVGLDYDADSAQLYWTHGSTPGLIRRANADGSNPQLLVSSLKLPRGIALDPVNGKMYWSEAPPQGNAMGLIRRANLDGTEVETVYTLTPYDPVLSYVGKPVVDPVNGYVYFCAANEIRRVKLDGTGPVQTVVRGLNTATALALDVAQDRIYFLDANTNSDILGRARLNDTDFTVLVDNSPGVFGSSGLFDLKLDLIQGKAYFTDELAKTVRRCNLDGGGLETIYSGPATHYPTGLTLDEDPRPPMQDCNDNGVRDLDDIESGTSADCNVNGIPDECEEDPCVAISYDLDHGSDPGPSGRILSGDSATGFEIFQPFGFATIPEIPGLTLVRIGLDGWTVDYESAGFRATIFPDDGSGAFPDESQPLAEVDFQFRFSPNTIVWIDRELSVFLPSGRYYVRLTALSPQYEASVNLGITGEPSFSRRLSNGQIYPASSSIALRLLFAEASSAPSPNPPLRVHLAPPRPNPSCGASAVTWTLPRPGWAALHVVDPAGRLVRTLASGPAEAGSTTVHWNGYDDAGRPVGSGVYFLRLETRTSTREGDRAERILSPGVLTTRLVVLR